MNEYLRNLNQEIQKYLKILSPQFPEWLLEYIYTPEMQRLDKVGMSCGTFYTKVYNDKYFYSTLTHSVAVALIIWNFTHDISKLWPRWIEDEDRACMQFIADVMKWLNREGYVTIDDLYKLSEKEVIKLIENCKDSYIRNAFKNFRDATKDSVYKSDEPNDKIYCTSVKGKKRYINPLVKCDSKFYRIYDVSNQAKEDIENFKNMKMYQYIGFEFDFKT